MKIFAEIFAVAALVVTLAGCIVPSGYFTKPDMDFAQFDHDKKQCIYEANLATAGNPDMASPLLMPGLMQQCMEAKGYTFVRD